MPLIPRARPGEKGWGGLIGPEMPTLVVPIYSEAWTVGSLRMCGAGPSTVRTMGYLKRLRFPGATVAEELLSCTWN